jgi:gluconokinase
MYQIGMVLEERVGAIKHIVASGGFTKADVWLQMMADIFQREVWVMEGADASAVGAAMLGMHALGLLPVLADGVGLLRRGAVYVPDAGKHGVYAARFGVFAALYEGVKGLMGE